MGRQKLKAPVLGLLAVLLACAGMAQQSKWQVTQPPGQQDADSVGMKHRHPQYPPKDAPLIQEPSTPREIADAHYYDDFEARQHGVVGSSQAPASGTEISVDRVLFGDPHEDPHGIYNNICNADAIVTAKATSVLPFFMPQHTFIFSEVVFTVTSVIHKKSFVPVKSRGSIDLVRRGGVGRTQDGRLITDRDSSALPFETGASYLILMKYNEANQDYRALAGDSAFEFDSTGKKLSSMDATDGSNLPGYQYDYSARLGLVTTTLAGYCLQGETPHPEKERR